MVASQKSFRKTFVVGLFIDFKEFFNYLTDTGEARDLSTGENVQKWTRYFLLFFRRVRATSMTQRLVENTCVHFLDVFACIG